MTIMSGLVGAEHRAIPSRTTAGEWYVRNAWRVILTGSTLFWCLLAGLLIWG